MATKRNVLGVLMGIELVLNGANLNFVAFGSPLLRAEGQNSLGLDGQLIALFVIVLAAAEAAVALAIALNYYHTHVTVDVDRGNELKGIRYARDLHTPQCEARGAKLRVPSPTANTWTTVHRTRSSESAFRIGRLKSTMSTNLRWTSNFLLPLLLALAWLLPLASFVLIVLFGPRMGKGGYYAAYVATGAIVAGFVLSVAALGLWLAHFPLPAAGHGSHAAARLRRPSPATGTCWAASAR